MSSSLKAVSIHTSWHTVFGEVSCFLLLSSLLWCPNQLTAFCGSLSRSEGTLEGFREAKL